MQKYVICTFLLLLMCSILFIGCIEPNDEYKAIFKKYPDSTIYITPEKRRYFVITPWNELRVVNMCGVFTPYFRYDYAFDPNGTISLTKSTKSNIFKKRKDVD